MPSVSDLNKNPNDEDVEEAIMLNPSEIEEEIISDGDVAMDSGSESDGCGDNDGGDGESETLQEVQLQNDSIAYFDLHNDSIFCIAQHPLHSNLVVTGGSEGDDDAGGMGYIFDASLKASVSSPVTEQSANEKDITSNGIKPLFHLEGHTDSISSLAFTLPKGEALLSAGLDGKLRVYTKTENQGWIFLGESQEVEEINWLTACPYEKYPNTVAIGASDGSVWIYSVHSKSKDMPLQIIQSYFLHTGSCTAGNWSNDGKLLATVSEDGSLYVWDVFGESASAGVIPVGSAYVVGLSALDQRFAVDGGLFSVAISPDGSFLAVGGAGGSIKIVSLPRLISENSNSLTKGKNEKQLKGKSSSSNASAGQAGKILADIQAQTDGIETLAFSSSPTILLAAGSVDGSIAIFDSAHQFAIRRLIKQAHGDHSVVKVEFVQNPTNGVCLLTSCGMDGVVRRWDTRGGSGTGLIREWKGHRGDGEGGGVLGFVQGDDGSRIITAGDDGISLIFDSSLS
ncbi:putative WD repeat-containing protein C25H1.08c [Erysiphe neolycopersici]|uniref:Putative WD repeat-containing protein C25H1.08c n=1 Tax=Erysiphe neolycopersici TaxID=212602 RepID=A0A420HYB1_9PEZI|nr:putative WD repeat-containing protein C25H1.08c [Erysiphe neolycopersici]